MKLAYISDIHVDFSQQNLAAIDVLAARLKEIHPDAFILAGDVSPSLQQLADTLAVFGDLPCLKLFVPGNHDIWIESKRQLRKGNDSTKKYCTFIPEICRQHGFAYPALEPCCVDHYAFIGTIGWYDYSLRNTDFDHENGLDDYAGGFYQTSFWRDKKLAWWFRQPHDHVYRMDRKLCCDDVDVSEGMVTSLREQLAGLSSDTTTTVIAITHHVPFREMVHHSGDIRFDFFSAYMGSEKMGEVLLADNRVKLAICGHSHRSTDIMIGHIRAVKSPLGYNTEWPSKDIGEVVSQRLGLIDIE